MLSKSKAKKPAEKNDEKSKNSTQPVFPILDYLTEKGDGYRTGLFSTDNGFFMRVYVVPKKGWLNEEINSFCYEILFANDEGELKAEPREVKYENACVREGALANATNSLDLNCLRNKMECLVGRPALPCAESEAVRNIPAVSFRTLGVMTMAEKRACRTYVVYPTRKPSPISLESFVLG